MIGERLFCRGGGALDVTPARFLTWLLITCTSGCLYHIVPHEKRECAQFNLADIVGMSLDKL